MLKIPLSVPPPYFLFFVPLCFSLRLRPGFFLLPPLQSPVFLSCSPLFFFPLVPWISTSAVPPPSLLFFASGFRVQFPPIFPSSSPLWFLIFSGFIARECQAFETASILYSSNGSWGGRRRRRLTNSKNGAVCVMGTAIFNLATKVLKSCNQVPG